MMMTSLITKFHGSRRLGVACAAAVLTAALVSGCIFDTRQANPPVQGTPLPTLDKPKAVFESLRIGLKSKTTAGYERAVSSTFTFSPLLQDSLDQNFDPGVFSGWTKTVEVDVTEQIMAEADSLVVAFTPSALKEENTFVRYRTQYSLRVVPHTGSPTTYRGVADIDVRNEGGVWRMTFWDEVQPVANATSWGFLRGTVRQQLNP